jgi:hypothetical protein
VSGGKKPGTIIYTEGAEFAEGTEFGGEPSGSGGAVDGARGDIEERFLLAKNARRRRGLATQADPFAGANGFRKIGLLRSE